LQGGLGNQLFIYYAAVSHSIVHGNEVEFETSALKTAQTKRELSLDDFALPVQCVRVQARMPRTQKILTKLLPNLYHGKKYFEFVETGFNEDFLSSTNENISGYFQSWRYVEMVLSHFPDKPLKVLEPSVWASNLADEARVKKPIACHIRRGDYVNLSSDVGMLDYQFYQNAVQVLRNLGASGPVWIFSDSPDQIDDRFVQEVSGIVIREPHNSKPTDVFHVLQSCDSFIISNSTFSWWAAFVSKSIRVIAPNPWFRSLSEPIDLIPDDWYKQQSEWSNE
jgi:hypothetical protein